MSIRITLLTLLVVALAVYAWRDWFVSLCGLVLMMAVLEHPDMPKSIAGIQGLNPWNVLMADILLAWCVGRRREGLVWDLPASVTVLLLLYLGVVLVGFVRMIADPAGLQVTFASMVSEYLVNCVKWVLPALLLFDGCRSPSRLRLALAATLALYFILALQVIRWMPPSAALSGDQLSGRALKIVENEIGYSRVNMSMLLSGASWAMLALLPLARSRWQRAAVFGLFLIVAYAQALTGGRMGYVTWGVVGLVLCLLKWRRLLLVVPFVPAAVAVAMPGVAERMLQGFGQTSASGETVTDEADVTSDRMLIWPYVIEKIGASPAVGYGRQAMIRSGLAAEHAELSFAHPHNAYLEWLLDNGLVGFALVMPFYLLVLVQSVALFLDRAHPLCAVVGGVSAALVLALLVASMGSQTFYPREGAVGMWAAIALVWRLHLERGRVRVLRPASLSPVPAAACVSVGGSREGLRW